MPDFAIPSFKYGMDQRRARAAGAVSTLWDLGNAHITRGGDVQACKAFVPKYVLPAGCFGLAAVGPTLFTFGSASPPTMPPGVIYQQLVGTGNMIRVVDAQAFVGNTYVIAEYDTGELFHFYSGARVTDWDAISAANCSFASLAGYLADKVNGDPAVSCTAFGKTLLLTSRVAGVATTVTAAVSSSQTAVAAIVQAAVAPAAEIPSQGSITILSGAADGSQVSGVTIGGTPVTQAPVAWFTSNDVTANAVAAQINNLSASSGYYAAAAPGGVVNIFGSPGTGATPNGLVVAVTVTGSVNASTGNMAGGAAAVAGVAQVVSVALGGTLLATAATTITVGANAYKATTRASGMGTSIYVFLNRVYSCANTHLQYCTIADPSDWSNVDPASGAGFINIASQTNGSERLVMAGAYAGYAAIFSARAVRLYQLTTDATAVTSFQSMQNQGSICARSLQSFATTDVFYLDLSGIRSLRERDTTFTAYAADVGSAVDSPVQAWMAQVGDAAAFAGVSVVEPLDGRYWLAIGNRIWVYSYFPSTQVGAWSHYDPGFVPQAIAVIKNKVYLYDGTTVYLYGGDSGQVYPAAGVLSPTFTTPFHNPGNAGSSQKIETEVEIVASGTWQITIFTNPDNLGESINGGIIVGNTYTGDAANVVGRSKLFSLQMTCTSGGYSDFSSFILNYLQKAAK